MHKSLKSLKHPIFEYQLSWNLINADQELNFSYLNVVVCFPHYNVLLVTPDIKIHKTEHIGAAIMHKMGLGHWIWRHLKVELTFFCIQSSKPSIIYSFGRPPIAHTIDMYVQQWIYDHTEHTFVLRPSSKSTVTNSLQKCHHCVWIWDISEDPL